MDVENLMEKLLLKRPNSVRFYPTVQDIAHMPFFSGIYEYGVNARLNEENIFLSNELIFGNFMPECVNIEL